MISFEARTWWNSSSTFLEELHIAVSVNNFFRLVLNTCSISQKIIVSKAIFGDIPIFIFK